MYNRSLIYRSTFYIFLPCGTMSHTILTVAGDVDARRALDSIITAEIKTRVSQGGGQ